MRLILICYQQQIHTIFKFLILSLTFSLCTGLVKKLLKATRNKKKKHNNIVVLARSRLNSIASKISEALTNNQISHEDFKTMKKEVMEDSKKALG